MNPFFFFLIATTSLSAQFEQRWQVGTNNDQGVGSGFGPGPTQPPPGSPIARDDDYYLEGNYPGFPNVVREPLSNIQDSLKDTDPVNRTHFILSAEDASTSSRLRFEIRFVRGLKVMPIEQPGFREHEVRVLFNGIEIIRDTLFRATTLRATFTASEVNAVVGPNVITLERVGGVDSNRIGVSYYSLSADPDGNEDADNDGLPLWYEEIYAPDGDLLANEDLDGDSLTNFQEYEKGTNPTLADSDSDGLTDSQEIDTSPLNPDSDGDSLIDGKEIVTSPTNIDSDNDGYSDSDEITQGTDPTLSSSRPEAYPGCVSLQFVSEDALDRKIPTLVRAGLFSVRHWNHTPLLPRSNTQSVPSSNNLENLKNSEGEASTIDASWTIERSPRTKHRGSDGNALLFSSIARGVDRRNSDDRDIPATIMLSEIPFSSYDLIVYVGTGDFSVPGVVRLTGSPEKTQYVQSGSLPPFARWKEIKGSTPEENATGNYIRYSNLSGNSQEIVIDKEERNVFGIHGLQIIDRSADADDDGMDDSQEFFFGLDVSVNDAALDPDNDGVSNSAELLAGTDPQNGDSDFDGLTDGEEVTYNTDPLNADSDGDRLSDGDEIRGNGVPTDPNEMDTDGDGFSDRQEYPGALVHAGHTPALGPVWDGDTQTWSWTNQQFRILWDHQKEVFQGGGDQRLAAIQTLLVTDLPGIKFSTIQLVFRNGMIVPRVTTRARIFHQPGFPPGDGERFFNENGPERDLADYGFSGVGRTDESDPLTLSFFARRTSSTENRWELNFEVTNHKDPSSPVSLWSWTSTPAVAGTPELLNGTAVWREFFGNAGANSQNLSGGSAYATATPYTQIFFTDQHIAPVDSDDDGLPDAYENSYNFLNPNDPADAALDQDGDDLTNLDEFLSGTDPSLEDSDSDGSSDREEILNSSDPLSDQSFPTWRSLSGNIDDQNSDGFSDAWLLWAGGITRSPSADDDGDGVNNLDESLAGTDPDDPNSALFLNLTPRGNDLEFTWPQVPWKRDTLLTSPTLNSDWLAMDMATSTQGNLRSATLTEQMIAEGDPAKFFRVGLDDRDQDSDGVSDWVERVFLESSPTLANSLGRSRALPSGQVLSGDAIALIERANTAGTTAPATVGLTATQASRFLTQATWGPTVQSIAELQQTDINSWIDEQLIATPSSTLDYFEELRKNVVEGGKTNVLADLRPFGGSQFNHRTAVVRNALLEEDQLRQRMAFALSQIFVVERAAAPIKTLSTGSAQYYDLLGENAFGTFQDLLEKITFHPIMGLYLSYVRNQKADPSIGRTPDENYAREIMQLFTIGLWELNPDGTRKLDSEGDPIPTYDNDDITELARVFTGLVVDSAGNNFIGTTASTESSQKPLVMYPEEHDFGTKNLLRGVTLPARTPSVENGIEDIRAAVASLVNHPNTPPFISKKLIQFFVTSNPTPAYVERIQDVFVNDGTGTRGNLGAVLKAILLDPEARIPNTSPSYGKLREPFIRTLHLLRNLEPARDRPDFVWWTNQKYLAATEQDVLSSPTVFNFYTPEYQAPGLIRDNELVSPVFEIFNTFTSIAYPNFAWETLEKGISSDGLGVNFPMNYDRARLLVSDLPAFIDHLDLVLCAGTMTPHTRTVLQEALEDPTLTDNDRILTGYWLVHISPEGSVQK